MRTVADWRGHSFAPGSPTAALVVLATFGLFLLWFLNPPYQNSSSSINPPRGSA